MLLVLIYFLFQLIEFYEHHLTFKQMNEEDASSKAGGVANPAQDLGVNNGKKRKAEDDI